MPITIFQEKIKDLLPNILLRFNEPMSKHTSFRIGGPAEIMAFPRNSDQIFEILNKSKILDCPVAIMGAGTNILAPDRGVHGIVICLKDSLTGMTQLDDTHIRIAAGVTMTRAAVFASGCGLSGMEFAHGIPGSIGGGVYMNAGAYGGEISAIFDSADIMWENGQTETLRKEDMLFSYRHSILADRKGIVLSAVFSLKPDSEDLIKSRMSELMKRRSASQPLDKPSAGSAFKRPEGAYAAALIEQCGYKGFSVGSAAISSKHAGFVVNMGQATAQEVSELLRQVSDGVYTQTGIRLEPEIRVWKG